MGEMDRVALVGPTSGAVVTASVPPDREAAEVAAGRRCVVCHRAPGVLDSVGLHFGKPGWVCSLRCRVAQVQATKLHDEGAGL